MKQILFRALSDTFRKKMQSVFLAIVGFIITCPILYFWMGREVALEELKFWVAGVCGAFGAVTLLFFWNLIRAPFRIKNERISALELETNELRDGNAIAHIQSKSRQRLISMLSGIDNRLVGLKDLNKVRMEPDDLTILQGLIAELGDFSPVKVSSIGSRYTNCTLLDGTLGKTQAPELIEVNINILESLRD